MADENPTTAGISRARLLKRSEGKATLYRHFDKDGALLYVGISLRWTDRTKGHQCGSSWFSEVASITLHHFETLKEALAAEKVAIMDENPLCNVMRDFVRPRHKRIPQSSPYIAENDPGSRFWRHGLIIRDIL